MGVEIIFPIAWFVSVLVMAFLLARSRSPLSRPFALPTLIASALVALLWSALAHEPGYYWAYAMTWFAPTSIVLGCLAHSIKWLLRRQNRAAAL
jgi:hypothetical protein